MDELLKENIQDNIVIIKINKSFREDMSALELYDVSRGCWKRKIESVEKAEYALSVVYGEVKEVYKIYRWVPAEQMERETIPYDPEINKGRIAFFGEVAKEEIRNRYIGKNVNNLYKRGEADPVKLFLKQSIDYGLQKNINIAKKPDLVFQSDDRQMVKCPNCDCTFIKSPRCPELNCKKHQEKVIM